MDSHVSGTMAKHSQPYEDKAALAQQVHYDDERPNSYGHPQSSVQQDYGTRAPTLNNSQHVSYQGNEGIPDPMSSQYTTGVPHVIHVLPLKKSILEAYLLSLLLGVFGAHHFYLHRIGWGIVYLFTFGLVGFGYVIDLFRVPYLVRKYNREHCSTDAILKSKDEKNISDAYVAWFPFGLFGFHHYYLGNKGMGALYTFTVGLFGIGWIVDMFRMPSLVKSANERITLLGNSDLAERKSLGICYLLAIPFGMLGLHHFYLRRYWFGVIYLFTFGLLGVGWMVDLFRMPILLRRCNDELTGTRRPFIKTIDDAYTLWFPFGLVGYHHYYLRRRLWGLIYALTLGLFGIGWLIDLCRIPSLVKESNERIDLLLRSNLLPGPCVIVASADLNNILPNAPPLAYAPPPPYYGPSEGNIPTGYTNSAVELPPPYEK